MSLKERLQQDWKDALKGKEKFKANVISMAKAAVLHAEKTDGSSLDDEQIVEILAKEVKQRKDAIEEFKKGNRQDLVDDTEKEIQILMNYLPQQLTQEEIFKIIKASADEVGANSIKDMGKLMSAVMPKFKGRADGKLVNKIVKEYLSR
ncbi:GatB/YqeY domain-containing protein [Haloimpatiens lingqiaonensis]|uniref:GatB/YqeY domain-containing protein n=1 Tax=Haloimpatiens lingqiaonensis TaxID=1380675 RepID=UPI0010FE2F79|nr:GatB/YqeY domain-containing protein [Haloimpatiens lingqiaonensis]